jgi:hypothetical protein
MLIKHSQWLFSGEKLSANVALTSAWRYSTSCGESKAIHTCGQPSAIYSLFAENIAALSWVCAIMAAAAA